MPWVHYTSDLPAGSSPRFDQLAELVEAFRQRLLLRYTLSDAPRISFPGNHPDGWGAHRVPYSYLSADSAAAAFWGASTIEITLALQSMAPHFVAEQVTYDGPWGPEEAWIYWGQTWGGVTKNLLQTVADEMGVAYELAWPERMPLKQTTHLNALRRALDKLRIVRWPTNLSGGALTTLGMPTTKERVTTTLSSGSEATTSVAWTYLSPLTAGRTSTVLTRESATLATSNPRIAAAKVYSQVIATRSGDVGTVGGTAVTASINARKIVEHAVPFAGTHSVIYALSTADSITASILGFSPAFSDL